MKTFLFLFLMVFSFSLMGGINELKAQNDDFCNGNCEQAIPWSQIPAVASLDYQYPGYDCYYNFTYKVRYNPCTGKCELQLIEITKNSVISTNCPNLTPEEIIDFAFNSLLSNMSIIFASYSICIPDEGATYIYTAYMAPCWHWVGDLGTHDPQSYLAPCESEGCCIRTYKVEKIGPDFIPTFQSSISHGICTDPNPNCFTICE